MLKSALSTPGPAAPMLQLKPQARMEMVVCIDGPMRQKDLVPYKIFTRKTAIEPVYVPYTLLEFGALIHRVIKQLRENMGATFLVHSTGGDSTVSLAYSHLIETLTPERVQAFNVNSGSAATNTALRAGYHITTPMSQIFLHAAVDKNTRKVPKEYREAYTAWWAAFLEDAKDPALVARIRSEVFKDNWDDESDDLPVDLTGAELAALGKAQLLPDVWMMQGVFNGFLPEAALDPMVRGFWERALVNIPQQ